MRTGYRKPLTSCTCILGISDAGCRRIMRELVSSLQLAKVEYTADCDGVTYLLRTVPNPDVVIVQHDLPGGGCSTVSKFVRWDRNAPAKTIPIIAIGFNWTRQDVLDCFYEGVNEVIALPTSLHTIQRSILSGIYSERPFISTPSYCGPDRRRGLVRGFQGPFRRLADTVASEVAKASNKSGNDGRLIKAGQPIAKPQNAVHSRPANTGGSVKRPSAKAADKGELEGVPLVLPNFARPSTAGSTPNSMVPQTPSVADSPLPSSPTVSQPKEPDPLGITDSAPESNPEKPQVSETQSREASFNPPLPPSPITTKAGGLEPPKSMQPKAAPPLSAPENRGGAGLSGGNSLPSRPDRDLGDGHKSDTVEPPAPSSSPASPVADSAQKPHMVTPPESGGDNALPGDLDSHEVAGKGEREATQLPQSGAGNGVDTGRRHEMSEEGGITPSRNVANQVRNDIVLSQKTIATQDDLLKLLLKPKKKN